MRAVMQKYSNYCHKNSAYFVIDSERGLKKYGSYPLIHYTSSDMIYFKK
jgi:hypothetical protein